MGQQSTPLWMILFRENFAFRINVVNASRIWQTYGLLS